MKLFLMLLVLFPSVYAAVFIQEVDRVISTIAWSSDGQMLAIGGRENTKGFIVLYDDARQSNLLIELAGTAQNISFYRDSARLAVRHTDNFSARLLIWDQPDWGIPPRISQEIIGSSDTNQIVWSPTGRYIAANGSVWVYIIDTSNGQIIAQLWDESLTGNAAVLSMAWSEDEQSIIALYNSPERNQLLEWNVTTAQVNRILWSVSRLHPIIMSQSADGQQLAVSVGEGSVFIFNTATGEIERSIAVPRAVGSSPYVSHLFWSADDQTVYGVTSDGTVYLWDMQSGNLIAAEKRITGEFLFLRDVDMSPYRGQLSMVIASHSREITPPSSTDRLDETILLDGLAKIIVPAPSLDRLNAIAALCVRDGNTGLASVQGLAQPAASTADLPAYIAHVEALPADAIPPACRADLLAVAGALLAGE